MATLVTTMEVAMMVAMMVATMVVVPQAAREAPPRVVANTATTMVTMEATTEATEVTMVTELYTNRHQCTTTHTHHIAEAKVEVREAASTVARLQPTAAHRPTHPQPTEEDIRMLC